MNHRGTPKPNGQLHQSQVVSTYGPGAMLDLPKHSVLIASLDHWTRGAEILEPRLVGKLRRHLDRPGLRLYAPPPENRNPADTTRTGMEAWEFPEWFITQDTLPGPRGLRGRRLVHLDALKRGRHFEDDDRKLHPVVPVRFVRACPRAHIGDIEWSRFLHGGESVTCRPGNLWWIEYGNSGDLSDIWIRCGSCPREQPLVNAQRDPNALRPCDGARPWIGPGNRELCGLPSKLLNRTSSHAYFAQTFNVISIPDPARGVARAVDAVWTQYLQHVRDVAALEMMRQVIPQVTHALEGLTGEAVLAQIQARRDGVDPAVQRNVKLVEFETLTRPLDHVGSDAYDGDFQATNLPAAKWDPEGSWGEKIERVVLVHRLREVVAQVGFTRFEPFPRGVDGELPLDVTVAPLSDEADWLPAVENRGEGIFIQFRREAVESWRAREAVVMRGEHLESGFDAWKRDREVSHGQRLDIAFPDTPYLMLHSLAHMLMTTLTLECGYPSSSVRERIYADDEAGYGILLYTGTTDAEGTLGGLVESGRRLGRYLGMALEIGSLCSNDPVCSQHRPSDEHEGRYLHGAACHGCLLIAETSCELFNEHLDRALVVPTVDNLGAEFFPAAR